MPPIKPNDRVPDPGVAALALGVGIVGWAAGTAVFTRLRDTLVEAV